MTEAKKNQKFKKNSGIIASQIDDETVMMDIEKGNYFGLNNIGSFIWQTLDEPHTIDELVTKLAVEFDVSEEDCLNDITPFIENMTKSQLLIADK